MSASSAEQKLVQIKALCQKANLSQVVPSVFTAQMLIEILEEIQDLSVVSSGVDKKKSGLRKTVSFKAGILGGTCRGTLS